MSSTSSRLTSPGPCAMTAQGPVPTKPKRIAAAYEIPLTGREGDRREGCAPLATWRPASPAYRHLSAWTETDRLPARSVQEARTPVRGACVRMPTIAGLPAAGTPAPDPDEMSAASASPGLPGEDLEP